MTINRQVSYFDQAGKPTIPGLQFFSTIGRVIPPALTTTQRNAYQALPGETIFNTTTGKLNFWTGTAWEAITSA